MRFCTAVRRKLPLDVTDPYGLDVDLNLIPPNSEKNRQLRENLKKVDDPTFFTVAIHANAHDFYIGNKKTISVSNLANLIRSKIKKGDQRPIKLLACNANATRANPLLTPVGTQLAKEFKGERAVISSQKTVTVYPDGTVEGDFSSPLPRKTETQIPSGFPSDAGVNP